MTETSLPAPIATPAATRGNAPRVVAGVLTAVVAAGLLAGGGSALWADHKSDHDGYVSTSRHEFGARTAALTTQDLHMDLNGAHWVLDAAGLGKVRLKVASTTSKPIFVGVARTRDVRAYLAGTARTTLTDLESDPFRATYHDQPGRPAAAQPPARRHIWTASAAGRGTQTLRWHLRNGSWSVVVMNADGSPGVRADVTAGARV